MRNSRSIPIFATLAGLLALAALGACAASGVTIEGDEDGGETDAGSKGDGYFPDPNPAQDAGQDTKAQDAKGDTNTSGACIPSSRPSTLVINEVDYDQPGGDTQEFIEIYNAGTGSRDLKDLEVVLFNGSLQSANDYAHYPLNGRTLGPGQYLVIGATGSVDAGGALFIALDTTPAKGVQNGDPDAIAIINTKTREVVDSLTYGGEVGFPCNLTEGQKTEARDKHDAGGGSLVRMPNGADTNIAADNWRFSTTPTPGRANE